MKIPVFYDLRMAVDSRAYSPSAAKPQKVIADWLVREIPFSRPKFSRASRHMLKWVHAKEYVDGVFAGTRQNGHGNTYKDLAVSTLWTVGSMVAASRHVLKTGLVACSPTSGFHHACYEDGGGFCTFNGLMVAAVDAIKNGAQRVGIVDCDWHYGNGTSDIRSKLKLNKNVLHYTIGNTRRDTTAEYFTDLEIALSRMIHQRCELVLYQAGADAHIDDPLGGAFTDAELQNRDYMVFNACKRAGMPLVWNLAGGYQRDSNGEIPKVLGIHRRTMEACIDVYR